MKFSTQVKSIRNGMEFSHGLRRALVGALMLVYLISLGFDVISVTTLFAVSVIIGMLLEFPTGAVADYDSRKKSLLISFFLMSLSFLGIFLFKSFWVIAGFWVLNEIAWTFSSGASSAWAIDALDYAKKKSKLVSLISQGWMSEKVGHVIGGVIGLLVVAISFRFVWLSISLVYFVLLLVSWRYIEERNFEPEKVPHSYLKKSLIKARESISYLVHKDNRDLRILMYSEFLISFAWAGFVIGVPLLFTQNLALRPEYLSGLYAVASALAIGGPLVANRVIKDKFGKLLFSLMFVIGVAIVAFAVSGSLLFAVLTFAVVEIAFAAFDTIIESARHHEFDSKIRASLGSMSMIIFAIAYSIGMFLTGFSVKFLGVVNTLIISGAIMFLTAFVYLWMKE